jgi:hypothetical protein
MRIGKPCLSLSLTEIHYTNFLWSTGVLKFYDREAA